MAPIRTYQAQNSENMQIMQNTKMDKMPRARRIFVLNKSNPETVENEIMEIASMLKFGFGRWNELMTYPFPFKFLLEYLDDACETAFSKHWKDITYKGELQTIMHKETDILKDHVPSPLEITEYEQKWNTLADYVNQKERKITA